MTLKSLLSTIAFGTGLTIASLFPNYSANASELNTNKFGVELTLDDTNIRTEPVIGFEYKDKDLFPNGVPKISNKNLAMELGLNINVAKRNLVFFKDFRYNLDTDKFNEESFIATAPDLAQVKIGGADVSAGVYFANLKYDDIPIPGLPLNVPDVRQYGVLAKAVIPSEVTRGPITLNATYDKISGAKMLSGNGYLITGGVKKDVKLGKGLVGSLAIKGTNNKQYFSPFKDAEFSHWDVVGGISYPFMDDKMEVYFSSGRQNAMGKFKKFHVIEDQNYVSFGVRPKF